MTQSGPSRERALLLSALDNQREHVLEAVDGLADEALRRAVLPSGWTCLTLIRHLTIDVEEWWFGAVLAAEPFDQSRNSWHVGADESSAAVLDGYRAAVMHANANISTRMLDAAPEWWPEELFGSWRLQDLHEMLLHVITETATHAGHLDAVRELLDGRQNLVLT